MRNIMLLLLLAAATGSLTAQDWRPFRWLAANGPRDLEFLPDSVRSDSGVVTVLVRRERATTLAQDPTIAPETNPWTRARVMIDCREGRWMMAEQVKVDGSGRWAGAGSSRIWIPLEANTLAAALKERFCPAT
jgi:hypothetical protein